MTKFERILTEKRVVDFLKNLETLSEAEAAELIDQLDESTIQLIEAVLSEIKTTTPIEQQIANLQRKLEKQANKAKTKAALRPKNVPPMYMYGDDPKQNEILSRDERSFTSGVDRKRKMTRIKTKIDQKRARAREEAEERAQAQAERDEQRRDFERDTMRGFR